MNEKELKNIFEKHELWLNSNGKKGERADFREANLSGANFNETNLRDVNFSGATLKSINFKEATLLDIIWEKGKKYIYPESLIIDITTASFIKNYYRDNGLFTLSDHFYVKQMECVRKEKSGCGRFIYYLWKCTYRYGTSINRWIATSCFLVVLFGFVFLFNLDWFKISEFENLDKANEIFTPFYFSIVTFTTLGFGDVTPIHLAGKILVTIEVIIGYIMLGGLITMFAKKFIRN